MISLFKNYHITVGLGEGKTPLTSLDAALLNSGVANYNLVKVSSILPAHCEEKQTILIEEGNALFTAFSSIHSNVIGETISAAIAIGIPEDSNQIGVIMEHAIIGSATKAESEIRNMIEEAMQNRNLKLKKIKCQVIEHTLLDNACTSVFAGVAMW